MILLPRGQIRLECLQVFLPQPSQLCRDTLNIDRSILRYAKGKMGLGMAIGIFGVILCKIYLRTKVVGQSLSDAERFLASSDVGSQRPGKRRNIGRDISFRSISHDEGFAQELQAKSDIDLEFPRIVEYQSRSSL